MPILELKKKLSERIGSLLNLPSDTIFNEMVPTPDFRKLGQVALPCFQLAKTLKKSPAEIAKTLEAEFENTSPSAKAMGPYVNFSWPAEVIYQKTLTNIFQEKEKFGSTKPQTPEHIIIEYCSPNIAKPLAFQHIRSTLIGNALANIYKFSGHTVERINFVGDWGTQFSRLLAAFEMWGDLNKLNSPKEGMQHLFQLYVRFHKELENREDLTEKASDCQRRLEQKDAHTLALWKKIKAISLQSMQATLDRLSVSFDHVEGESQYLEDMDHSLAVIKTQAGAEVSEGAWIVRVDGISTPALIQKSDGNTLYLTRDIAAAIDRYQRFRFDRILYVVANQQALHFQLLFGVLSRMGYTWFDKCEHVQFGTVLFGKEKMSTREGNVVFLNDLLDQAKERALKQCISKNPELKNIESVAEKVGIGAVVFGELSSQRQRDIEFNWEQILSFEGETGPYLQYSVVRCRSLIKKAEAKNLEGLDMKELPHPDYSFKDEEAYLIFMLAHFRSTLFQVMKNAEPSHLASYLIDVAKAYNQFYNKHPVLQAEDKRVMAMRLNLVKATEQVLVNGLGLLSIECPEEM